MALRKDQIQLDIIIGNDKARKQLAELEAEAAGLKKTIREVKSEHKKYERAAESMTGVEKNMQKSKAATLSLETEITGLNTKLSKLQAEIKQTGNADTKLIAKEKELKRAIEVKNAELLVETNRFKSLQKQQTKLIAVMNRTKQASNEYVAASEKLKTVEAKMQGIRNSFDLTKMSMRELNREAKTLKMQLHNAIPGSEAYLKYEKRLQAVNARIKELSANSRKAAQAQMTLKHKVGKVADGFNKFSLMAASVVAALAGVWAGVKNLIQGLAKYSDVVSEVRKTTGLTEKEVDSLNKKFKEFDTRTGRKELLEYSRIAGKLGIEGVENISSFVEEANVAVVSLGKALGGSADETVNTLGKIIGAFDLDTTMGWGDAIKHVGAVVNELGKSSTASEKPIVEYISRLSSVGVAAEIPIEKIAALGATLDSLKVPAEQGSTSMMKFIYSLSNNVTEFSKLLGVTEKEYSDMLSKDVNEVMIKVLKSAKSGEKGLLEMTKSLDAADVSGVRMTATVGTLINNLDELERQQGIATEEFKKGTSTLNEYNLMNNNFAGQTEKTKKKIKGLVLSFSKGLKPAIEKVMQAINWLIDNFKNFYIIKAIKKDASELGGAFKDLFSAFKSVGGQGSILKSIFKLLSMNFKMFLAPVRIGIVVLSKLIKGFSHILKYSKPVRKAFEFLSKVFSIFSDTSDKAEKSTSGFGKTIEWLKDKLGFLYDTAKKVFNFLFMIDEEQIKADEKAAARRKANSEKIKETYASERQALIQELKRGEIEKEEYYKRLEALEIKYNQKKPKTFEETKGGNKPSGSGNKKGNDTKALKEMISQLNLEIIKDEREKAKESVRIWYEKEKEKIRISKASAKLKADAVEALEGVHKKKLADIDKKYKDKILKKYKEASKFLTDKTKEFETGRKQIIALNTAEIAKIYDEQIKNLEESHNTGLISETEYQNKRAELVKYKQIEINEYKLNAEKEFQDKINAVREQYNLVSPEEKLQNELDALKESYDQKLLSYDEYLTAKSEIEREHQEMEYEEKMEGYQDFIDSKMQVIDAFSSFMTALKENEMSEVELAEINKIKAIKKTYKNKLKELDKAEKKELLLAGKNETKKEEIKAKFEKLRQEAQTTFNTEETEAKEKTEADKKGIMKKYADKEFAVKAASIIANSALAVMKALSSLGPIAGAIASVLIVGTGIAQLAKANNERQKVKALKKGKYPVIGADDNKPYDADYTQKLETGIVGAPTLVGEEPEMVVDNKTLYNQKTDKYGMTVMDHAKSIMAIKYNKVPQYAKGKDIEFEETKTESKQETETTDYSEKIDTLTNEFKGLRKEINEWVAKIEVYLPYEVFEDAVEEMETLKKEVSIEK